MGPGKFDPRHSGELLKHMDKQNEVLIESRRSMLDELHTLQVQEEMLVSKLYEVMSVHGHTKQATIDDVTNEFVSVVFKEMKTIPIILQELKNPIMKSMQHMRNSKDNSDWT